MSLRVGTSPLLNQISVSSHLNHSSPMPGRLSALESLPSDCRTTSVETSARLWNNVCWWDDADQNQNQWWVYDNLVWRCDTQDGTEHLHGQCVKQPLCCQLCSMNYFWRTRREHSSQRASDPGTAWSRLKSRDESIAPDRKTTVNVLCTPKRWCYKLTSYFSKLFIQGVAFEP